MAFTTAQRQARYRERLKARATGVTPEMILRAAQIIHAEAANDDEDYPSWAEVIRTCSKKPHLWLQWLPDDPQKSYEFYGRDAELLRAVAEVVDAVLVPPPAPGGKRELCE